MIAMLLNFILQYWAIVYLIMVFAVFYAMTALLKKDDYYDYTLEIDFRYLISLFWIVLVPVCIVVIAFKYAFRTLENLAKK